MHSVKLVTRLINSEATASNENKWTYEISNPSKQLAFFINPQLWNDVEEIMPSFWSANYFSLAPGEKITLDCQLSQSIILYKTTSENEGLEYSRHSSIVILYKA